MGGDGGEKPLCCEGSEGLLWRGCLYFFQCDCLSLSLPPTLPLPHSAEASASSKDTLVDSRKSGCCRSDKNLVGVSVWVEPAEEQRWLHHSSLGTRQSPSPTRSTRRNTQQTEKRVKDKRHKHTLTHSGTPSTPS